MQPTAQAVGGRKNNGTSPGGAKEKAHTTAAGDAIAYMQSQAERERRFVPIGTIENSPAFQRRVMYEKNDTVPRRGT